MVLFVTVILSFAPLGTQAFIPAKGFVSPRCHTTTQPLCLQQQQSMWSTSSNSFLKQSRQSTRGSLLCRYMYNLPPSGGNNNENDLQGIWTGIGTIAALVLFFASPLGSVFFAITNSLFLLALVVPVLAIISFQLWQYTSTLVGECPQCGAPVRVVKPSSSLSDEPKIPSLCFSCGALVQPTNDLKGIELASLNDIMMDDFLEEEDAFSSSGTSGSSILDSVWNQVTRQPQNEQKDPSKGSYNKKSQYRREQTVIDVDVQQEE